LFFSGKAKRELGPLAERILVDCRDGKVDEVYAAASKAFRESTSLADFRRFVDIRAKALGPFKAVEATTGGGMGTGTSGTSGSVQMRLAYERGTAEAEFQFVKEDDVWRLVHVKIPFDERLAPAPDPADLEPRSRALLDLYGQSSFVALYARFSAPLQEAWKADVYEPQMRDLRAKTGAVLEATLRDAKDAGDGKTALTFDLRYENGPGRAVFTWFPALGEWHLVAFDLRAGDR
jgi:hypothetical protein